MRRAVTPFYAWATPLWRLMPSEHTFRNKLRPFFSNTISTLLKDGARDKPPFLEMLSSMDPFLQIEFQGKHACEVRGI